MGVTRTFWFSLHRGRSGNRAASCFPCRAWFGQPDALCGLEQPDPEDLTYWVAYPLSILSEDAA
jgi:hypothetical protein